MPTPLYPHRCGALLGRGSLFSSKQPFRCGNHDRLRLPGLPPGALCHSPRPIDPWAHPRPHGGKKPPNRADQDRGRLATVYQQALLPDPVLSFERTSHRALGLPPLEKDPIRRVDSNLLSRGWATGSLATAHPLTSQPSSMDTLPRLALTIDR